MAETSDTPRHNKTAVPGGHLAVDSRTLVDSMPRSAGAPHPAQGLAGESDEGDTDNTTRLK